MPYGTELLAQNLITEAFRNNGSDIHFYPESQQMTVQLRALGDLTMLRKISANQGERLISHFKFKASLDIGEKRKPQSGATLMMIDEEKVSLRISTLPAAEGKESMVIRLLPQSFAIPIEKLSLFSNSARILSSLVRQPQGLLLFSGPTGSGKSTTLYSLIHYCSTELNRNIITLEDPVERNEDHVLQVQINERAGVTYASGLKAVLRHDPDMIIIGEIRDEETADIAVKASLSGHLVLSTLHAKDTKGAIRRMIDLGIRKEDLKQSLIGATGQRLVKININGKTRSRTSIYEIMTTHAVCDYLDELPEQTPYATLEQLFRKGAALGYVSPQEYHRWITPSDLYSQKRSAGFPSPIK
ncbi:competence type IV pilus ATPase ComGA [Jeotgalibacillus haloalkalitolerans]|uniref:Competence type IV pilus ATPase ComGA n=1 Tax=Jeotgalibacillus haloalkalitolerans TaxID=3104292 RepID=A0ABU5KN33_9BACL|nr:competence type IV pilus ATPase ComGA [Jeotgalibacillus sp. HH7-29]MDZ5712156.1 competence type IV pilus ATPase ComGA [Jeotgalibacillus sp. HH7-29]